MEQYQERLADPRKVGPGKWDVLHFYGRKAKTSQEKENYRFLVSVVCDSMRCAVCHGDCTAWTKANPVDNYWNLRDGMFQHSVDFHNYVNKKLGKPTVPLTVALKLYDEPEICEGDCDGKSSPKQIYKTIPRQGENNSSGRFRARRG